MRTLLGVPIVAVLLAAATVNTGYASCCGAASYRHVGCCQPSSFGAAKQQCYTVMKTFHEKGYRQQSYTICKTVYETGNNNNTYTCCKMVSETHIRKFS